MKDWTKIQSNNTIGDLINGFNTNSDNSAFIDSMIGNIISNGLIFTGRETIGGKSVIPLASTDLTGVVPSNVEFDNFVLYFKDTNALVELNQFPVNLLSYATGKPQFIYFKQDKSYRVSEYMYGQSNEVLLARFVINTNGTWNQFYLMAQRAGTPTYSAGNEFYELDGLYVNSPEGLKLSTTEGTVKRSGISFTDKVSPDIYTSARLSSTPVPIRYINNYNRVDYSAATRDTIITNKILNYDMNFSKKIEAEELIRMLKDKYIDITNVSLNAASELNTAITSSATLIEKQAICKVFTDYLEDVYSVASQLDTLLQDVTLSSINRTDLELNISNMGTFLDTYLRGLAISISITNTQVLAMRKIPAYLIDYDDTIYNNPMDTLLQAIQNSLNAIVYSVGSLSDVETDKYSIQRILWDVYEDCFIVQYGNVVYDTFEEAASACGLLNFPPPFGKTIYIPTAIIIVKSGITDINADASTVILSRRWIYVDNPFDATVDSVARTKSDLALSQIQNIIGGTIPSNKADSLKYTNTGTTYYANGDFYLNYENQRNRLYNVNNLTSASYNASQVLSAYQGYLLEQNKLSVYGGTLISGGAGSGTINAMLVIPKASDTYTLGNSSNIWSGVYANNVFANGQIYKGTSTSGSRYVYSGSNTVYDVRAMANSSFSWASIPNGTAVFCW